MVMHYMELGGAEMALLGLLQGMDYNRYHVDVMIHAHRGELMSYLPSEVRLLPEDYRYAAIEAPIGEAWRRGAYGVVLGRLAAKIWHRAAMKLWPQQGEDSEFARIARCVTPFLPKIQPEVTYDMAISFLTPHNIVRDKVCARCKVAWIHTDYANVRIHPGLEAKVWGAFNHIISISEAVSKGFIKVFPSLAERIVEMDNLLPKGYVRERAQEGQERDSDERWQQGSEGLRLLSIGRYCEAKNYDNVPDICRRLLQQPGVPQDLRWYIIGYGSDEWYQKIQKAIAAAGMAHHVIMLGKRSNPYPYIADCDLYVQPSRYEGKSVTVREAQMLGRPVAITAYQTAPSQVRDGLDGVITPLDNEGCAQALAALIRDSARRQALAHYCAAHDFSGLEGLQTLYNLIP